MSTETAHRLRAEEALTAARHLHGEHPAWALVPLFYSAMHLMHARFDADRLGDGMRHPTRHTSVRDRGVIVEWGTLDVVRVQYSRVSAFYVSLFEASRATRYSTPLKGDGQRLWDDYDALRCEL